MRPGLSRLTNHSSPTESNGKRAFLSVAFVDSSLRVTVSAAFPPEPFGLTHEAKGGAVAGESKPFLLRWLPGGHSSLPEFSSYAGTTDPCEGSSPSWLLSTSASIRLAGPVIAVGAMPLVPLRRVVSHS